MSKIFIQFFAVMAVAAFMAGPCFCEGAAVKTIDGDIILADWQQSVITVKWLNTSGDGEELEYKEKTLSVPEGLKISKGTDVIGLMDVEPGDHVIVEYQERPEGVTVKSITVKE